MKKSKLHIEGAESMKVNGREKFYLSAGKVYNLTADKIDKDSFTYAELVPGRDHDPDDIMGTLKADRGNPNQQTAHHPINAADVFDDGTDYVGTVTVWNWTKADYSDIEVVGVVTIGVDA